jgi:hypothetical protein
MTQFEKLKQRTFSNTWNNFEIKPKKINFFSIALRNTKKYLKKFIKISVKIKKLDQMIDPSFGNKQIDKTFINKQNFLIQKKIIEFLKPFNLKFKKKKINIYIKQFHEIYFKSPVRDLGSGIAYNQGLLIYIIIKIIKPTDVVESGVMRGFSTYIIDKALEKSSRIHCYDISFNKLIYKSQKASYHENDISKFLPKFKGEKILSLYDDHVSHLDRLQLSKKLKIRFNIFDDDLNFFNFHSDGWPPLPTVNMLINFKQLKTKNKILQWISQYRTGKIDLAIFKKNFFYKKKYKYNLFPDLFDLTGYRNHGQTSFLIL